MIGSILIADDDPVGRELLAATLAEAGHHVSCARDGDEAWRCLRDETSPLLAILDWQMPGIDGLELCRRAGGLAASRPLYLILLTARAGREAVVRGLEAGAHDYITKPFDPDELSARVRVGLRVLALQRALADRVRESEAALASVKHLRGLLPICSYCKSIRSDQDYWQQVEHYLADHTAAEFSHGICPGCYERVIEPQLALFKRELERKNG
ncbi:MAG: response regulator transcription factor [Gemmataceae bacterium]